MTCADLLAIDVVKDGLTLLSGERGLSRNIRWIYFADCMDCLDSESSLLEWIHGGELIVVTNRTFSENTGKLLELMRLGREKSVAGFVINTGQTPEEAVAFSEETAIPVFEIGWNLKMVDLSQILCLKISEEMQQETTMHQLFSDIIYPGGLSERDLVYQAEHYGVDLSGPHYVLDFDIDHLTRMSREGDVKRERCMKVRELLLSRIKDRFRTQAIKRVVYLLRGDGILLLLRECEFPREKVTDSLEKLQRDFKEETGMTVSIGIGNSYHYISEFCRSADEARKAVEIIHVEGAEGVCRCYDDIGLYYLISQIEDKKLLEQYYRKLLGPLIDADTYSDSSLCGTLESYLAHNGNANETAKDLFIHRNTMRYRLEKIAGLLHRDLADMDDCTELNLAFHIRRFLEN